MRRAGIPKNLNHKLFIFKEKHMRRIGIVSIIVMTFLLTLSNQSIQMDNPQVKRKLQHIVLIQFKDSITPEEFAKIEAGAMTLKQIKGVQQLKLSENVSPENLNQGYTHSLTMWFATTTDRDEVYLPHPVHQDFVNLFVPYTEKVLVFDYWE